MTEIGFMQGRLSPPINGKIQAFPLHHWQDEFRLAQANGFGLIEWTLDQERLAENPLMTAAGRREIRELSGRFGLRVGSLTGDCFMQAPFHKAGGAARIRLLNDMKSVLEACGDLGLRFAVVPLVDNGRLENTEQETVLRDALLDLVSMLEAAALAIVFESDYPPEQLRDFIARFPSETFGINYDIGNSAALGFDPEAEIGAYGARILNVHVKDRVRGGATVPLGQGAADLPRTFDLLARHGYRGNYILQTARALPEDGPDGDVSTLVHYRDMVRGWLSLAGRD